MPILVQATERLIGLDNAPSTGTLGDSGIVFNGPADEYGCVWGWNADDVRTVIGNKPAPREETGDRAHRDGQWDGTRFYGPRQREIAGEVLAPSHAALHDAEQRLREAIDISLFPFWLTEPGFAGVQYVRQSGELMWTESPDGQSAVYTVNLYAPDPLTYATQTVEFTLGFPVTVGGATWPRTWPSVWAANVTLGVATLSNPLSEPRPLLARLDGPVGAAGAAVSNPVTGQSLHLQNPDNVPLLAAGEFLTIDAENHQLKLMGTASRRSWAWGDWPVIPKGDSQIALTGAGDPAARFTGAFTPARL